MGALDKYLPPAGSGGGALAKYLPKSNKSGGALAKYLPDDKEEDPAGDLANIKAEHAEAETTLKRDIPVEQSWRSLPAQAADIVQAPFRGGVRAAAAAQEGDVSKAFDKNWKTDVVDYGDILYKAGLNQRLSDLPVTSWLFKEGGKGWQLNPASDLNAYLSSIAGVPANLIADPANYVSFGTGGLVGGGLRVAGKSGVKYLSKAGAKALTKETIAQMPRALKIAARVDRARKFTDITPGALKVARDIGKVADEIARRRAINRIVAAGNKKHLHQGGIQFAGRVIVAGEKFRPVASTATRVVRMLDEQPAGRLVLTGARKAEQIGSDIFRSIRKNAAKVPGFAEEVARFHGRKRYLKTGYTTLVNEWGKVLKGKTLDGKYSLDQYAHLHLQDPGAYPLQNMPPAAHDAIQEMRLAHAEAEALALDLGMKDAGGPSPVLNSLNETKAFFSKFGGALAVQEHATRVKRFLGVSDDRVAAETFKQTFPELTRVVGDTQRQLLDDLPAGSEMTKATQAAGLALSLHQPGTPLKETMKLLPDQVSRVFFVLGMTRKAGNMKEVEEALAVGKALFETNGIDPAVFNKVRASLDFNHKNVVDQWNTPRGEVKLTKKGGKEETWWLPEDVAEDFNRATASGDIDINNAAVRDIVRAYDVILSNSKAALTNFPSTATRNIYTNAYIQLLDTGLQSFNVRRMATVVNILRGADGTVQTPLGNATFTQFRQQMKESILMDSKSLYDAPTDANLVEGIFKSKLFQKLGVFSPHKWNSAAENFAKAMQYVTHRERGLSHSEAHLRVNQWLHDMDDLSPTERTWGKRLHEFYTWPRKNFELMAKHLAHRPGQALAYEHLGDQDQGPDRESLPQYLHGEFKVKVKRDPKTGVSYIHGIDMPMRLAAETFKAGSTFNDTARHHIGSVSAVVTYLGQGITQQYWYNGKDFPKRETVPDFIAWMTKQSPELQKFLQFDIDPQSPPDDPSFTMNGTRYYLITNYWANARISSAARRQQWDPSTDRLILDIAAGAKRTHYDETDKEKRRMQNEYKRFDEALQGQTSRRKEFTKSYRPSQLNE